MSYFIAIETLNGTKATSRMIYPTKAQAKAALWLRKLHVHSTVANRLRVMDADHEPGQSVLAARHGFA